MEDYVFNNFEQRWSNAPATVRAGGIATAHSDLGRVLLGASALITVGLNAYGSATVAMYSCAELGACSSYSLISNLYLISTFFPFF